MLGCKGCCKPARSVCWLEYIASCFHYAFNIFWRHLPADHGNACSLLVLRVCDFVYWLVHLLQFLYVYSCKLTLKVV